MAFKTINGYKAYYEISGKGSPVLFIHGLGSSTLDWENQLDFFSKNFRVASIDLRGHGLSDSSDGPYSIKQFAEDAVSLIREESVPAHIIGISMGGMVGFQMAVDNPNMVKSLTVINSFTELLMDNRKNRKMIRIRKWIPRLLGMKKMGKVLGKKLFPNEDQEELRRLIAERWAKNSIKDYTKSVNALAGWTIEKRLGEINCPVLVIGSEFDYTSVAKKEAYTAKIPNAKLIVIPDTRHAVTAEKPDVVNNAIYEFLEEVD